jgi:sugar/nucleoside kinase (ribokinase family)
LRSLSLNRRVCSSGEIHWNLHAISISADRCPRDRPTTSSSIIPLFTPSTPDPLIPPPWPTPPSAPPSRSIDILVAGSLASDTICNYTPLSTTNPTNSPTPYTSNPATITQSPGGVGANVALSAHYAGTSVLLASIVGSDLAGQTLLAAVKNAGLSTAGIEVVKDGRTAQYVAINDSRKDLHIAMADMNILSNPSLEEPQHWDGMMQRHTPKWVVVDANWSPVILQTIIGAARRTGAKVAFEPVSNEKGARLFHRSAKAVTGDDVFPSHKVDLASPNLYELEAMYAAAREAGLFDSPRWWDVVNHMNLSASGSRDVLVRRLGVELVEKGVPQMMLQLLPYVPWLVVKLGSKGCLVGMLLGKGDERLGSPESARYILARSEDEKSGEVGGVYLRLFPPVEVVKEEDVVSVNGVGDTMLGVLMAGLVNGDGETRLEDVVEIAQKAAVLTLKSTEAVSSEVKRVQRLLGAA